MSSRRAQIPIELDGHPSKALVDSGADSTLISISRLLDLCPTIEVQRLARPFSAVGFQGDPLEPGNRVSPNPEHVLIDKFALVRIKFLCFEFEFPVFCYSEGNGSLLIGTDLITKIGLTINVGATSVSASFGDSSVAKELLKICPGDHDQQWFIDHINTCITEKSRARARGMVRNFSRQERMN